MFDGKVHRKNHCKHCGDIWFEVVAKGSPASPCVKCLGGRNLPPRAPGLNGTSAAVNKEGAARDFTLQLAEQQGHKIIENSRAGDLLVRPPVVPQQHQRVNMADRQKAHQLAQVGAAYGQLARREGVHVLDNVAKGNPGASRMVVQGK